MEHKEAMFQPLVRRMVRKRQGSSCSSDKRLTVEGRPRRLPTVCREKKNYTRRRHLVKDGQRVKGGYRRPPHASPVSLAGSSGHRWWLCVEPTA